MIPAKQNLAVAIVDTWSMGCVMGNPAGHLGGPAASSTILYALADPGDAEQETLSSAIANAKEKASMMARKVERKVGPMHQVNMMASLIPDDIMTRRNRSPLLPRVHHLSISANTVEVTSKVSLSFNLE